jgi:class 3 adenylate cyclase
LAPDVACPRCATTNPAGQKFCDACGQRLASEAFTHAQRAPRAYTPDHLAQKILTTRRALEGERKQVTVLFADVVGSLGLAAAVGAEAWHRVIDRFLHILGDGIHRFEGTINQFTGDGVMALFGAPIAHEDHARRACHAAVHLLQGLGAYAAELRPRGVEFAVRIGLNSGDVVIGKIGDDLRMDYTALGETVGLAARVEQIAAPGCIYLTEHTAALVAGFFDLRDQGVPPLKGVSAPVRVYELQGIGPLRTRLDVSRLRGFSRFVGREDELARLLELLRETLATHGRVIAVIGDAGVGKSRVCLEFIERCRAQALVVHEAHCPPHGKSVPLLPIRDLARSYFALGSEDQGEAIRQKVAERLRPLELEDALPLVLGLVGVPDVDPPTAQAVAAFLRRFVPARSAREPTVLLLDDVHWIDHESEEILAQLIEATRGTRTLLLINSRPEYKAGWMDAPECHQLRLAPLNEHAAGELLRELLGEDTSIAGLTELIHQRTQGNPFFVEEVVQALAGCGNLTGARGAYRLTAPLDALTIPETVQSLLAARLDRIGEPGKHVLQTAAVIGKQFSASLLQSVIALESRDLAPALSALQEAEFIYEAAPHPRPEYAFRHPLTQEVAYQSLLSERRAEVHAGVATAIERLHPDRLGEHASLIAHHWEAAGRRFEATRWRRRAALMVSSIQLGASRWRTRRG